MNRELILMLGILVVAFLTGCQPDSNASRTENQFKAICADVSLLLADSSEETDPAQESAKVMHLRNDLNEISVRDPDSIWADDALWVRGILSLGDPDEEIPELEKRLEKYPNMEFEEWTRKMFSPFSDPPMGLDVRVQLFGHYRELGENQKVKNLIFEMREMYPEYSDLGEDVLKEME